MFYVINIHNIVALKSTLKIYKQSVLNVFEHDQKHFKGLLSVNLYVYYFFFHKNNSGINCSHLLKNVKKKFFDCENNDRKHILIFAIL